MLKRQFAHALIAGRFPLAASADKPNTLWITSEDNSSGWLGRYSDLQAMTPQLDTLASEGFRFARAYDPWQIRSNGCRRTRETAGRFLLRRSRGCRPRPVNLGRTDQGKTSLLAELERAPGEHGKINVICTLTHIDALDSITDEWLTKILKDKDARDLKRPARRILDERRLAK